MAKYLEKLIDYKKTRREVQEHLSFLSRGVFTSEIQDFICINSPTASQNGGTAPQGDKIIRAIDKMDLHNEELNTYKEWILEGINKLSSIQKSVVLGKYVFQYDEDEFLEEFQLSQYKLKEILADAEIDLAIILDCVVGKVGKK